MTCFLNLLARAVLGFTVLTASLLAHAETPEQRLKMELLGLGYPDGKLPELNAPFANYVDGVQVGKLLFLSSTAPATPGGIFMKGRLPDQMSPAEAVVGAKLACARQVARIKRVLGDLERVERVAFVKVKILSAPDFTEHSAIADACSKIFVTAFGEAGKHARTTEGVASNPFGVSLEVETIVEVR